MSATRSRAVRNGARGGAGNAARPGMSHELREAREALSRWRHSNPAHAEWITDGAPTLTEAEHVERFGVAYDAAQRKR